MDKVFIVVYRLSAKGGGVNRAVMDRSKNLSDRGYEVNILTFDDFDVETIEKRLREIGRLGERITLLNIYDYYGHKNTKAKMSDKQKKYHRKSSMLYEKGFDVQEGSSKGSAHYYYKGVHVKRKKWNNSGRLKYISYYNEHDQKVIREEFHKLGYVTKQIHYDPASHNKACYVQYYTADGFCFLACRYLTDKKSWRHTLYDRKTRQANTFKNNSLFYTHWLNRLCDNQDEKPYIICDKSRMYTRVMDMDPGKGHRIYMVHSNHLSYPYQFNSSVKTSRRKLFNHLQSLDSVVVLTHKQKRDIVQQFGDYNNIRVIPHNIQFIPERKLKKDDKLISIVARLNPTKQIDHAIEAFEAVVSEVPDARLNIHGYGHVEKDLREKVKALHLEQNVFLKGYSNDTNAVYQGSLATLLTSRAEGFSMVILESMANGTPVISYDVNYGPRDIITDGYDGYLIPPDKHILASKIIELLKNPMKARQMGEVAKDLIYREFNEQIVIDQWAKMLEDLKSDHS